MSNTMYITNLDGTLLNAWKAIPSTSIEMLNTLIDDGALISVATSRCPTGIDMVHLDQLNFQLPVILMNGVVLYDCEKKSIISHIDWQQDTALQAIEICQKANKNPFVYYIEDQNLTIEYKKTNSTRQKHFVKEHKKANPNLFKEVEQYSLDNGVFLSIQDRQDVIFDIAKQLVKLPDLEISIFGDNYNFANVFLQAYSKKAGKHSGVENLCKQYNANRVIAFGDNYNDLSMLESADVAVVVSSSPPDIKDVADEIIGTNMDNSVAKFIFNDFYNS